MNKFVRKELSVYIISFQSKCCVYSKTRKAVRGPADRIRTSMCSDWFVRENLQIVRIVDGIDFYFSLNLFVFVRTRAQPFRTSLEARAQTAGASPVAIDVQRAL